MMTNQCQRNHSHRRFSTRYRHPTTLHGDWMTEALRSGVQRYRRAQQRLKKLYHSHCGCGWAAALRRLRFPARFTVYHSHRCLLPRHIDLREIEVLGMLAEGLGNKAIARRLGISEHTVKFHVSSIFTKLNALAVPGYTSVPGRFDYALTSSLLSIGNPLISVPLMQNLLNFRSTIASQNLYASVGGARLAWLTYEIAEVAVAALTETGHEGKIYDLTVRRRSLML